MNLKVSVWHFSVSPQPAAFRSTAYIRSAFMFEEVGLSESMSV